MTHTALPTLRASERYLELPHSFCKSRPRTTFRVAMPKQYGRRYAPTELPNTGIVAGRARFIHRIVGLCGAQTKRVSYYGWKQGGPSCAIFAQISQKSVRDYQAAARR